MVSGTAISTFKDAAIKVSFVNLTTDEEKRIEELAKELKNILNAATSRSS